MVVASSMESYAARLASFNVKHETTRKRASDTKGGKTLKWPHENPSPHQLAHAGLFYRPTSSCPDNTTCYLCRSNLDDWDEEDNPIEEHLKHARNCGWAISVCIEQAIEDGNHSLEDPMSDNMRDARYMTFDSNWPHEHKRGWTCKTQKMVDAGWHYCPTLESDDFVRCSYCSLSLDGWEPKDNPLDEHQRRSPDCLFFTLPITKPKASRAKKGRASNASRLSTQSNFTTVTEGVSLVKADVNQDDIKISTVDAVQPTKSSKGGAKATKARKGVGKAKGKVAKTKQEESQIAGSFLEPEDDDFEVKVAQVPPPSMTSKKRKSDEMSTAIEDVTVSQRRSTDREYELPPNKKRATRTRSSVVPAQAVPEPIPQNEDKVDMHMIDAEEMPPSSVPASKKKGKSSRKRASSITRKVSGVSTASKAALRACVPDDEEIDAALEADLDRPLTDEEGDAEPLTIDQSKGRRLTRSRSGLKKATASVASTRRGTRASTVTAEDMSIVEVHPLIPIVSDSEHNTIAEKPAEAVPAEETIEPVLKVNGTKVKDLRKGSARQPRRKQEKDSPEGSTAMANEYIDRQDVVKEEPQQTRSRQASRQLPARRARASGFPDTQEATDLASKINSSILDTQSAQDDSSHETDASVVKNGRAKRGNRNASTAAKKAKGGKKGVAASRNIEDIVQTTPNEKPSEETKYQPDVMAIDIQVANVELVAEEVPTPKQQRKETKAATKTSKGKKATARSKGLTREASMASSHAEPMNGADETSLPQPPSAHSTPKPAHSPQSSDAENQPPSSRPSAQRPPLSLQSPSKSQTPRVPLALATHTASPSEGTFAKLQTTLPWTAVDLERIFQGTPTVDKENVLFKFVHTLPEDRSALTSPEKKLSVEQWIKFNAQRGEEKLRYECEQIVGKFEGEGMRALKALEGIKCTE
ncbi:hypothetical protein N7G274_004898 [Stereocaulon virgatum]|uniref:BIR-domain-containing protein n=1 Tax=Stereocaulon virgatum TaxID=373712 RepID=A0ABR4AC07_9LECA